MANKIQLVKQVRHYKSQGLSKSEISRQIGLSRVTIDKYLSEDFNPVHASYGRKRPSKLAPYYKEIDHFIELGAMGSKIEEYIRQKGYEGSSSTIRHYISACKRENKMAKDHSIALNGLERDYNAVINTIQLPYSNGLAEGMINKLKMIKRVMYGRCYFDTLRSKVLQVEKLNEIN